jgi:hypothetical protein
MFGDDPDLLLTGTLLLNGQPVTCPACDTGDPIELHKRGPRETWPAFLVCLYCGHGDDHPVITNGLVDAAIEACPGRTRATDRDLFAAEWRGLTLVGERDPGVIPADIVTAAKVIASTYQAEGKSRGRAWWRGSKKSAERSVSRAAGGVKSAALAAAWQAQTGGAGPAKQPSRRCRTKGCRGGWVTITSRIHGSSGKAEQVKTPCATCHRALNVSN